MSKENQIVDYKQIVRRLKACVFTVIDPALASEAALAIQLLCEENQAQRKQSEGEWTYGDNDTMKCTLCRRRMPKIIAARFCPNCGAKMKGGE